jgi:hypothetical protein
MPKLNKCPKCKGNMYKCVDHYGVYEQCLQCGYTSDTSTADNSIQPTELEYESPIT